MKLNQGGSHPPIRIVTLVPKLQPGNWLVAKLCLATSQLSLSRTLPVTRCEAELRNECVPKLELGHEATLNS